MLDLGSWEALCDFNLVAIHDQYINVEVSSIAGVAQILFTAIYASCVVQEWNAFRQELIEFNNDINMLWIVVRDFNIIAD